MLFKRRSHAVLLAAVQACTLAFVINVAQATGSTTQPFAGSLELHHSSSDWADFTARDDHPTFQFDRDTTSAIRPWIGFSECSTCTPGEKTQAIRMDGLDVGHRYSMLIVPAYVSSDVPFEARPRGDSATLVSGGKAQFHRGYQDASAVWLIRFVADKPLVEIELGSTAEGGTNYLNFGLILSDYFVSSRNLPAFALQKYKASYGDAYPAKVLGEKGDYLWTQPYLMDSCITAYELTGDVEWLARVARRGHDLLALRDSETLQRDYRGRSGPVWQEGKSHYAWIGFTGAAFKPMLRMARLVASRPDLRSVPDGRGSNLLDDVEHFSSEFDGAVEFFREDWRDTSPGEGTYVFPRDIPVEGGKPLRGQPVAFNMGALFMGAMLEAGLFHKERAEEVPAERYLEAVRRYAHYLERHVLSHRMSELGDNVIWNYSSYYQRADDIGHGNFVVQFVLRARQEGLGFEDRDIDGMANTYDQFLKEDGLPKGDLVDGRPQAGVAYSLIYWHLLAGRRANLIAKDLLALHRRNYTFVELISEARGVR